MILNHNFSSDPRRECTIVSLSGGGRFLPARMEGRDLATGMPGHCNFAWQVACAGRFSAFFFGALGG